MGDQTRQHRIGLGLVFASALAWSTAGLFTRMIPLDTATILVWRGLFGALGLLALGLTLDGKKGLTDYARLGLGGWGYAVISALGMLCFIGSLRLTTVAHVAIIYAVVPFLAAGLSWLLLRQSPTRDAVIASAVSFVGAVIMVGLGREGTLTGDALALGMTLVMALMMVLARRFPGIPTLPAATLSALLSALASLPFATMTAVSPHDLFLLAAFGLTNSALGLSLFLMGSRLIPPIESALIGALDAPLAPLWVWLFFAEAPSSSTLAGGSIVLAAVLWHISRQSAPAPTKAA